MIEAELGRLVRVDLREIWLSESTDFTPWLAAEANLGRSWGRARLSGFRREGRQS